MRYPINKEGEEAMKRLKDITNLAQQDFEDKVNKLRGDVSALDGLGEFKEPIENAIAEYSSILTQLESDLDAVRDFCDKKIDQIQTIRAFGFTN